jgi:hypothetical protein
MEKLELKKNFGRAYIAGLSIVAGATIMAALTIWKSPTNGEWVLTWYGDLMKILLPVLVGGKALEKIGLAFGQGNIAKHNGGKT